MGGFGQSDTYFCYRFTRIEIVENKKSPTAEAVGLCQRVYLGQTSCL